MRTDFLILFNMFVGCERSDAHKLLDSFQHLLNTPELDSRFHKDFIVASQRISANCGLYPFPYVFKNVAQINQSDKSCSQSSTFNCDLASVLLTACQLLISPKSTCFPSLILAQETS
ncbi:hypothetical protein H2248_010257 [Termitomyces sp. 'cryptogamus']|nr:hypothetical protein H2248_010257 [Termitomyces sp. 'cryptogamus']